MESSFTAFDVIVFLIMAGSLIYAMLKGFTTMLLTLGAWIGAILVALYAGPPVLEIARDIISPDWLADVIALPVLFLTALVLLKLLADAIGRLVRGGPVGSLDRSLGALLGLFLGCLLVSSGYLLYSTMQAPDDQPDWVKQAKLQSLAAYGAAMVATVGPDIYRSVEDTSEGSDLIERLRSGYEAGRQKAEKLGEAAYDARARQALDKEIEQIVRNSGDPEDPDSEKDSPPPDENG